MGYIMSRYDGAGVIPSSNYLLIFKSSAIYGDDPDDFKAFDQNFK